MIKKAKGKVTSVNESLVGAAIMQTLTIMLQMRGVITEHTLIIKALVALAVCYLQTPSFELLAARFVRRRVAST